MTTIYRFVRNFIVITALGVGGLALLGRRFGRLANGSKDCNANSPPEAPYDVMAGLVVPFGYSLEEHFVTTEDGYILRLFRLGPKADTVQGTSKRANAAAQVLSSPSQSTSHEYYYQSQNKTPISNPRIDQRARPVVFMQHPLMGSSVDYIVMGPGRSLGFMLADAGYDVWLTNVRGNRFSRNHTRLQPDTPADAAAFWSFSWDQHAALDLPAALEYVAATTGQPRMAFVGYSQGTTIALAALSSQPAVANRVAAAVLLAPVAFVTHMTSYIFRTMAMGRLEKLFHFLGMHEYAAHVPALAEAAATACARYPAPCKLYLTALCGANPQGNLDTALLPAIMRNLPSGTSVQNMEHWGQLVRATDPARLSHFDYGTDCSKPAAPSGGQAPCNQVAYNSRTPPAYNLTRVAVPLALFTGGHDALSGPRDVALLLRVLGLSGSVALHHHEPDYGHLDFGVGHDACERIYPAALDFLTGRTPAVVELDMA